MTVTEPNSHAMAAVNQMHHHFVMHTGVTALLGSMVWFIERCESLNVMQFEVPFIAFL